MGATTLRGCTRCGVPAVTMSGGDAVKIRLSFARSAIAIARDAVSIGTVVRAFDQPSFEMIRAVRRQDLNCGARSKGAAPTFTQLSGQGTPREFGWNNTIGQIGLIFAGRLFALKGRSQHKC